MAKNDDSVFEQVGVELAAMPPHVADFRRRQVIGVAAKLGIGAAAMAALSGPLAFPARAASEVKLPEITAIPEKLKGKGSVRVCSWGGALQAAQREAYFKPFEKLTGIRVVESEGPDIAKVKAMVDTHTLEYDIVEYDRSFIIDLEKKGKYFEKIDYSLFDTAHIAAPYRWTYAVDMLPYAEVLAYRTDAFKGEKPAGWQDFWDVKKFPGPRTLSGGTGGVAPELEFAEIAAGTKVDEIYPIDIAAAYASLKKIKPAIVKWWTAGAMPAEMLNDKEVVMGSAWNGRIFAIQQGGAPVEIVWNQGELRRDTWAIIQGTPNLSNAQKFCAFITLPISQARLSMLIPYGFVNSAAARYIPPNRLAILPTAPENLRQLFLVNEEWWADNLDAVLTKWPAFLLG